jgi:hypothetical protein
MGFAGSGRLGSIDADPDHPGPIHPGSGFSGPDHPGSIAGYRDPVPNLESGEVDQGGGAYGLGAYVHVLPTSEVRELFPMLKISFKQSSIGFGRDGSSAAIPTTSDSMQHESLDSVEGSGGSTYNYICVYTYTYVHIYINIYV